MGRIISEPEFRTRIIDQWSCLKHKRFDYVVGPGRSGAVASVYASHLLGLPFVPYKCKIPNKRVLIVDTAMQSGRTLRKASRFYGVDGVDAYFTFAYFENKGEHFRFWYEELSMKRGTGNEYTRRMA